MRNKPQTQISTYKRYFSEIKLKTFIPVWPKKWHRGACFTLNQRDKINISYK